MESMVDNAGNEPPKPAVSLYPTAQLVSKRSAWQGMRSRWIVPPVPEGWQDFALSEWELEAAEWTDLHHHDEVNIVIAGELHVRAAGTTVIARQGDTVRVAAGNQGIYWAPRYARMIAIYGPNDGHPDENVGYRAL